MSSIMLVDDDCLVTDSLAYQLRGEGFDVHTCADGLLAMTLFDRARPDVVILDIRLPGLDGLEICRRLRERSSVPIIMLTALGNEMDRVVGLEIGADDYLPKPFSFRELLARIRSVLRRVELDKYAVRPEPLKLGDLRVDSTSRRFFKREQEIQLSAREFDLLTLLMSQAGKAVSRDDIIGRIWGVDWSGDPRTLEVHIRWLRLKVEDDPTCPHYIQTVRGFGYRFIGPEGFE